MLSLRKLSFLNAMGFPTRSSTSCYPCVRSLVYKIFDEAICSFVRISSIVYKNKETKHGRSWEKVPVINRQTDSINPLNFISIIIPYIMERYDNTKLF